VSKMLGWGSAGSGAALVVLVGIFAVLAFGDHALVVGGAAVVIFVGAAVIGSCWQARRARRAQAAVLRDGPEITIDLRSPTAPRISSTDSATGLVDQMHFRTTLTQRVASARRQLQPLSLVVFELDGFERARPDRREQSMRLVGSVMRRTLRESDIACRFGDAAVAALLEDTPESGAACAAERLRRAVAATPTGRSLTISAGIACYPSHALDAHELLRRSVRALATARATGRDRVEIAGGD
jgi:two-component system, cell cycle response regulator